MPPLGRWVEVREARLHHDMNQEAAEQAHEVLVNSKLLSLLGDSLRQGWESQRRLEERMRQVVHEVQRTNALVSVLNVTLTKMCDRNIELLGYLKEMNSDGAASGEKDDD